MSSLAKPSWGLSGARRAKALVLALACALVVPALSVSAEPQRPGGAKKKPHEVVHRPGTQPKVKEAHAPARPPADQDLGPLPGTSDAPVRRATISNGLKLVIVSNPADPAVTVALRFVTGPSADPKTAPGLAAVTAERLRLEGNDARVAILARGGEETLTIDRDTTTFTIRIPSSELDLALFLVASRLGALKSTPAEVDEARARIAERAPMDASRDRLEALVFQGSFPYSHALLGSSEDRAHLLPADVDEQVRTHYGPSNAEVVISGNVDAKAAEERATERLGSIAKSTASESAAGTLEEQTNQRAVEIVDDDAPTTLLYGWALPQGRSTLDLEVARELLMGAPSGRLTRALADLGARGSVSIEKRRGPGLFTLRVELDKGSDANPARHAVEAALSQLGKDVPGKDELWWAKRAAWARRLAESRDPLMGAVGLADSEARLNDERTALDAIDGPAVRDASAKLLGPLRRTVVSIRASDAAPLRPPTIHRTQPTATTGPSTTGPTPGPAMHRPDKPTTPDDGSKRVDRKAPPPPEHSPPHHAAKRKGAP